MGKLKYLSKEIEPKWQKDWEKKQIYRAIDQSSSRTKKYVLSMFPYPSGAGLHVGHVRIYTGTDILARYLRMKGHSVLNPMGWDAFGLPAENAAIKEKKNPIDMVPGNVETFKRQMISLGLSFDWSREFATTDPDYYQWTQWLFLQLYKMKNKKGERLVYRKKLPIRWCPFCKTGLANEEVLSDGTHERCGNKTEEKLLPQWVFRITDYADRLLQDLNDIDWPEGILHMQRNWIGKKVGINIKYQVVVGVNETGPATNIHIECFTTRPDTNFGATFIVLAPEHIFAQKVKDQKVIDYIKQSKLKTDEERITEGRKKTGVFTGFYAINDLTGRKMPVWVSDFVLGNVGTGAVVAVPGHDKRDFEFAQTYNLPIIRVVVGKDGDRSDVTRIEQVQESEGVMINSGFLDGLDIHEATKKIMDYLEEKGWGKRTITYHLRDWIFSRQRYWGEPFPLIYCDKCGDENGVVVVPESELPVKLPYVKSYEPTDTGESPLSKIKEWVSVVCPKCGGAARRETDTMPNWAGSCWYFIYFARSLTPEVEEERSDGKTSGVNNLENWKLKIENFGSRWLPVDWYLGGAEHAVLHLLYARFWTKAFYDLKLIGFKEPFLRLRNVGMVLAEDHRKMSKSYGNVINPDEIVNEYGADTLRVYEAFMAPFNAEVAWSTSALQGGYRFLTRIWQIYHQSDKVTKDQNEASSELVAELQRLIFKVESDITNVKFNTAIAALMTFLNHWEEKWEVGSWKLDNEVGGGKMENQKIKDIPLQTSKARIPASHFSHRTSKKIHTDDAKNFLKLLAPFAPFISEEIWSGVFGEKDSIHLSSWPSVDKTQLKRQTLKIPVQVNGKLRAILSVDADKKDQQTVVALALADNRVAKYIQNNNYQIHYIEAKILNFVISI